jgi:hypothetical protein
VIGSLLIKEPHVYLVKPTGDVDEDNYFEGKG